MFRIESYITPIIWSYFSKYVKNFNSHDFHVSLWNGGAVFSNLELNLDVLDSELQIPLTFASGHIQELKITVPWRKITSEPIILNVKSMELVLKCIDGETQSKQPKKIPDELLSQKVDTAENPGYMRGLISKIVTNVRVNFENVVIKYVESDIAFSVNVGEASLTLTDENWKATFLDEILCPPEYILRKKLSFSDVNICLDRCNNAGLVDKFHDPMLYRCDFDVRVIQKFTSPNVRIPYLYRMDLFLGHLQFCVTDEQIPMLARLYNLFTWLMQSGNMETSDSEENDTESSVSLAKDIMVDEVGKNEADNQEEKDKKDTSNVHHSEADTSSWSGWASSWLFTLPNLFGEDEADLNENSEEVYEKFSESTESMRIEEPIPSPQTFQDKRAVAIPRVSPQITHLGVYIKTLTIIFKAVQRSCDRPALRRKIINIYPFLKCSIQGVCCDFILNGNENSHSLGVSSIMVHGLGYCPCGVQDCSSSEGVPSQGGEGYFEAGQIKNDFSYYSLFQPEDSSIVPEWCYDVNHKRYLTYSCESALLHQTPAFFLKYIVTRSDTCNEDSLKNQNPEISEILYHCVAAPCKILLCSGLIHRLKMIFEAINNYGSTAPSVNIPRWDVGNPDMESPITIYRLVIRQPLIEILAADHPSDYSHEKRGEYFRKSGGVVNPSSLSRLTAAWPKMVISWDVLELTAEDADGHFLRLKTRLAGETPIENLRTVRRSHDIQEEELTDWITEKQMKGASIEFSVQEVLVSFVSDSLEWNLGYKNASLQTWFSNHHVYNENEVVQQVSGELKLESVTCSTRLQERSNVLWLPFTIQLKCILTWEPALLKPSVSLSANLQSFNVFIGPETIITISDLANKLSVYLKEFLPQYPTANSVDLNLSRSQSYLLFKDNFKYEVVEYLHQNSASSVGPKKVGICSTSGSLIWKYSQKRTIVALNVAPMSFNVNRNNSEEMNIHLVLEYYCELTQKYHHFHTFSILQGKSTSIHFQDDYRHNVISSTNWRIRLATKNELREPVSAFFDSLIKSVELDSMHLPEMSVLLDVEDMCVHLVNHTFFTGKEITQPVLQRYLNTDGVSPEDHVVGTISLIKSRCCYTSIENVSHCHADFTVQAKILDYESLAMEEISEPVYVAFEMFVPDLHDCYSMTVVTDNVYVKIGASLIHSVLSTSALWTQVINAFDAESSRMKITENQNKIILHRVLVCNDLDEEIEIHLPHFESLGTDIIPGKDCKAVSCPYSDELDSDQKQKLTISCNNLKELEIDIHKAGFTAVKAGKSVVFAKVSNLSTSQKLINVSGPLILANGLDRAVEFSFLPFSGTVVKKSLVPSRDVGSTFLYTLADIEHFRFRLLSNGGSPNPWSNVILATDLRDYLISKSPIRVDMFLHSDDAITAVKAFVTILPEEIDGCMRYLVVLSPLYCLRSWLCGETYVHLSSADESYKELYCVHGKGGEAQMKFITKQEGAHFLKFQSSLNLPPTMTPVPLLPVSPTPPLPIDQVISLLRGNKTEEPINQDENLELKWPFTNDNIPKGSWNTEINPETEILVSFIPWIDGLPTAVAEIRPWALFINLSGVELLFSQESQNNEWDQFWVPFKGVFSPKRIAIPKGKFRLGIMMNDFLVKSPPLQFSDQPERLNVKKINKDCKVPIDCYSRLDLFGGSQLACLTIETRVRNRMLIMTVRPTYSIQNRAPFDIYAEGITIASAVPQRRESWTDARLSSYNTLPSFTESKTELRETAVPILHFTSDGQDYSASTPSFKYLALSCGGPWWFVQLVDCSETSRVADGIPGTKVAVTLPKVDCSSLSAANRHKLKDLKTASEAVVVGSFTKNGQVWVSISQDNAPQLMIHNKTSLAMFYAEREEKSGRPRLSTSCFEQFLLLPPMSTCHFSFCNAYNIFPQLHKKEVPMPDMLLAIVSQDLVDFVGSHSSFGITSMLDRSNRMSSTTEGSMPTGTLLFPTFDIEWQKLLNVNNNPTQYSKFGQSSVKISVEIVGYTHHVFIENTNMREISAQSVRSRFVEKNLLPPKCQLSDLTKHGHSARVPEPNALKRSVSNGKTRGKDKVRGEEEAPLSPSEPADMSNSVNKPWRVKVFIPELYLSIQDNFENGRSDKEFLGVTFEPIIVEQVPIIENSKLRPSDCPRRESWIYAVRIGSLQIDTPSAIGRRPCEFPVVLESIKKSPKIKYDFSESELTVSRFMDTLEMPSVLNIDSTTTITRVAANEVNLETVWLRVRPFSLYVEDRLLSYVVPSIQKILDVFKEGYLQMEKSAALDAAKQVSTSVIAGSEIVTHVSIIDSGVPSENPSLFYSDHEGGPKRSSSIEAHPLFLRAISFAPTTGSSSSGLNSSSSSVISSSLSNLRLASLSPPPPSPMIPLEPHGSNFGRTGFSPSLTLTDMSVTTQKEGNEEDPNTNLFAVQRVNVPNELIQLFEQLSHPLRLKMIDIQGCEVELTLRTEQLMYVALDRSAVQLWPFKAVTSVTTDFHLGLELTMHYTMGTIFTIGNPVRVLGSLELLGSPGTLARTVGTGLKDLVVYPYQGFLNGPVGFAAGLRYGVTSLARSVTSGTLVSLTNWAESVSRNIDRLTLDEQEQLISESARQVHLHGFTDGFVQGLSGFGIRILGAVGGISHHPIKNIMERGPSTSSVIGGVGRGVIGAVVKPIGGVAELISMTGQGLLLATGWKPKPKAKNPQLKKKKVQLGASKSMTD